MLPCFNEFVVNVGHQNQWLEQDEEQERLLHEEDGQQVLFENLSDILSMLGSNMNDVTDDDSTESSTYDDGSSIDTLELSIDDDMSRSDLTVVVFGNMSSSEAENQEENDDDDEVLIVALRESKPNQHDELDVLKTGRDDSAGRSTSPRRRWTSSSFHQQMLCHHHDDILNDLTDNDSIVLARSRGIPRRIRQLESTVDDAGTTLNNTEHDDVLPAGSEDAWEEDSLKLARPVRRVNRRRRNVSIRQGNGNIDG